jgi:hypothetical protein
MNITEIPAGVKLHDSYSNPTQQAPHTSINVLSIQPIAHRHIKAACTIQTGAITFDNILIVRRRPGCAFVAMSSRTEALLTPTLKQAISGVVLNAWRNGGVR